MDKYNYNQDFMSLEAIINEQLKRVNELESITEAENEVQKLKLTQLARDLLLLKQQLKELEMRIRLKPNSSIDLKRTWYESASKIIGRIIIEVLLNN